MYRLRVVTDTGQCGGRVWERTQVLEEERGKEENKDREQKAKGNRDSVEMGVAVKFEDINPAKTGSFFDKSEWLTTKEAAIYLRKLSPEGRPSVASIHKLVERGSIRRRKFAGKLFFLRKELAYLIESTVV